MAKASQNTQRKPRILITRADLETLQALIDYSPARAAGVDLLEVELGRAVIVGDGSAKAFCRLGSWATYENLATGQSRTIQLVLPAEADIEKLRVSVLTPVGASLLGLTPGAEFEWKDEKGRPHRLKLTGVTDTEETGPKDLSSAP